MVSIEHMNNINKKFLIILVVLELLICSCAKFITVEFIEKKTSNSVIINGWKLKPDLFSVRNIAGEWTKDELSRYFVSMEAIKIKEKDKTDILDINFENVSVILKPSNEIIQISLSYCCCVSYSSLEYIEKAFNYECNEKFCRITIPEDIDTILLKFDAVFYNGVLSSRESHTVLFDNIIVNDSTPIERIPVEIEMYRNEYSYRGI